MKLDGRVNLLFQTLYKKFDWYKEYEKLCNFVFGDVKEKI